MALEQKVNVAKSLTCIFHVLAEGVYTLSKISNWSPNIYMLVLKVRFGYTNSCLYKSTDVLSKLCMPFHLKMTGTSSTDDARVKVPSFQEVTFFPTI